MINRLVEQMSPQLYERLRQAAETGKWADGQRLTPEQQANTLQLVMAYQARHGDGCEHFSIGPDGNIVIKSKQELKAQFRDPSVILQQPPE